MLIDYLQQIPRIAVAVDCVVFGLDEGELKVLLVERAWEPFKGHWALPGGFVHLGETADEAARRELREETGIRNLFLEQLYTFSDIDRDPRERVISIAYYALVKPSDYSLLASTDAAKADWFSSLQVPPLAFDHQKILQTARERLKGKVRYQPIGFELLPPKFTMSQLQRLYEAILERPLDKRNFRKKVRGLDLLLPLNEVIREGRHRPAQLYCFHAQKYEMLRTQGFLFEI